MTIVKEQNYAVESLVYYYLKKKKEKYIVQKLSPLFPNTILSLYKSLQLECNQYNSIFFPNSVTNPKDNPNTSWFDLESDNIGINIKYGYQSSANSRIRDITKNAVEGINKVLNENQNSNTRFSLTYDEFRNKRLHKISRDIKGGLPPTIQQIDIIYIKMSYVYLMNFIDGDNSKDNIIFIKFNSEKGSCSTFHAKSANKRFKLNNFINELSIKFSNNTIKNPHKQTVQYYLDNKYIGFLELRSNKRAMLHLRIQHWKNLKSIISNYYD